MTKKLKNISTSKEVFLEEATALAEKLHCQGNIPGEPKLPQAESDKLTLDQILRIQVMLGFVDRAIHTLELGADPSHTINNISLLQLAKAYGYKPMEELLESYGAREMPSLTPRLGRV